MSAKGSDSASDDEGSSINPQRRVVMEVLMHARSEAPLESDQGQQSLLMGKVFRQPFTNKISMETVSDVNDYCVVDLFSNRPALKGSIDDLEKDIYVFKPFPMYYRTWIYHELFRSKRMMPARKGKGGDSLFSQAMAYSCVDVPINDGRWSPVAIYLPMSALIAASGDTMATAASLGFLWALYACSLLFNDPSLFHFERPATVLLRVVALVFDFIRLGSAEGMLDTLVFSIAAVLMLIDLAFGDIAHLKSLNKMASYSVVEELPKRMFILEREGADFASKEKINLCEAISGYGRWNPKWILVADIKGLIVELRPMKREDWLAIKYELQMNAGDPKPYIAMNIFSKSNPTMYHVRQAEQAQTNCVYCQARLTPGIQFCMGCGLRQPDQGMPTVIVERPPSASTAIESGAS